MAALSTTPSWRESAHPVSVLELTKRKGKGEGEVPLTFPPNAQLPLFQYLGADGVVIKYSVHTYVSNAHCGRWEAACLATDLTRRDTAEGADNPTGNLIPRDNPVVEV